jgi:hypothetical protein
MIDAPQAKRFMFGKSTIDLSNSITGTEISESTQPLS